MTNLRGSFVALVTPFKGGKVDFKALERLVEVQLKSGTSGIVPCGTTGESPTLSHKEHKDVIAAVVEIADGRAPVVAGAGSNSTDEAVELTRFAKKAGCDAVLSVVPYYNKPTQEGLYLHFKKIAEEGRIPVVLYNIPGRCGVGLSSQTIERLSKVPYIVGVKESTGSMDQTSEILGRTSLAVLSGDDSLTLPLLSLGAQGVISVAANIFPAEVSLMVQAFFEGKLRLAQDIHFLMYPAVKALFIETNPIPIKTAMALLGTDTGELRLPLSPMKRENVEVLRRELVSFKENIKKLKKEHA